MIARALLRGFGEWPYALIAIILGLLVFLIAAWLPNIGLMWQIVVSPAVSLPDKATILASFAGSIATNFTVFSAVYMMAIAVLFGVNAAMVIYYLKQRASTWTARTGAAAGLGGLASGFVGIGCAACGTFVLGPALSFLGATGLLALLPFEGQEFGVLGIGMLGFSVFLVAKKIAEPLACPLGVDGDLRAQK